MRFREPFDNFTAGNASGQRGWSIVVPVGSSVSMKVAAGVAYSAPQPAESQIDHALPSDFDPDGDWTLRVRIRFTPDPDNPDELPGIQFGISNAALGSGGAPYIEIRSNPIGSGETDLHFFNFGGTIDAQNPLEITRIHGAWYTFEIVKTGDSFEFIREGETLATGTSDFNWSSITSPRLWLYNESSAGEPLWEVDTAEANDLAEWYYADEQAVLDVVGQTTLVNITNEPNSSSPTAIDTARLQRVGEEVDAMIDAKLAMLGYVTPMEVDEVEVPDLADTHATKLIMRGISARMVAWKLNEPRMILSLSNAPRLVNAIDKVMASHHEAAERTLQRIGMRSIYIAADKRYDITAPAEVYTPTWATTYPTLP
jgi:hypothetical protein